MKKTLLSILMLCTAGALSAQICVPNPEYADEPFGIWPDVEEGFADGEVGVVYGQVIDFKIPSDLSDIPDSPLSGQVDSIIVVGIEGLPPGLSFSCESHTPSNCTFLPEVPGCAVISGVPTEGGVYPLQIQTVIHLVAFNVATSIPFNYDDYTITIDGPSSVTEMAAYGLALNQNMPNPFHDETVIEYSLNQPVMVEFNIFNLLGKNIHSRQLNGTYGVNRIELSASSLNMTPGIYLYSLTIGGQSVTRKMVVR